MTGADYVGEKCGATLPFYWVCDALIEPPINKFIKLYWLTMTYCHDASNNSEECSHSSNKCEGWTRHESREKSTFSQSGWVTRRISRKILTVHVRDVFGVTLALKAQISITSERGWGEESWKNDEKFDANTWWSWKCAWQWRLIWEASAIYWFDSPSDTLKVSPKRRMLGVSSRNLY